MFKFDVDFYDKKHRGLASITPDNDFKREKVCIYKNETYSVRDNGAVLRHPRENGRVRPTDNQWTFGKPRHSAIGLLVPS